MRTKRRSAPALGIFIALALSALPTGLSAASPSPATPSPGPSESPGGEGPGERPAFQAWFDRPLPIDVAPGDDLDVGATIWDATAHAVAAMRGTLFLRALPASGAASAASSATANSDWPGHFRGTLTVPPGGLDTVQIGMTGTLCENDVCGPNDWVFDIGGIGPPPEAPITSLAEARIDVGSATVTAGEPSELGVVLVPNAEWESLAVPPEVVVRAREPRGPNLVAASLPLVDAEGLAYAGSITIPRSGDVILEAAIDEDGGDATRFGTSMVPVSVVAASGGGTGDPGAAEASADEGLPTILVVAMALVAIVGAGVVVAGFRSGGR